MSAHYLDELNPAQREAAELTDGPLMIIAGAGSGKTRVLTYRIAHIIEKGEDPFHILALTFTNKAAREMKGRIAKIIGESKAKDLWMGTFHSVFAKILRFEAEKLGYPKNFTIYDTDDSKSLIKEILKTFNLDDKVYKPSIVLNRISSAKNSLISYKQYLNNPTLMGDDRSAQKPMLGQVYEAYQKRLFRAGAMDFDDLLFNTNVLLRDFPDVLLKYQDKFRYILVDEYQDTNFSQYVIVRQLAARFENICVVGDDAQSIYSFRGANIQNILNFEKDYPDVKKIFLEQNYRSTQTIVNAANSVIANNKDQFQKNVWTHNAEGAKIKVIQAASDSEEGHKIASLIFQTKMQNQRMNSDFAILYRTNAQSRSFEEGLRKLNIPYRIYGGLSFYQRKEIKDVLAYFRLSINPHDDEAMRRIINYPARGIGQTTVDKISVLATDNDVSMFTVLDNLADFNPDVNAGTAGKLRDFTAMLKSFGQMMQQSDAYDAAHYIVNHAGILRELNKEKTPEEISRVENVEELLSAIKEFCEAPRSTQEQELKEDITQQTGASAEDLFAGQNDTGIKTLDEFMQEVALLTDADKNGEDEKDADKVSLMTIHSSKGLEFPYVFVVGMEENLFPSQMVLQSRSDLEEERRLFYVAITRAEKQAFLSYAERRFRYGNHVFCEPSRFIDEIDGQYLDYPEVSRDTANRIFDYDRSESDFHKKKSPSSTVDMMKPTKQASPALKRNLISANKVNASAAPVDVNMIKNIQVGTQVQHDKFGTGQVLALEGDFPNIKATINFSNGGQKQLLLKFAKLTILA